MPQDRQAQADQGGIRGREPVRVQDCQPDSVHFPLCKKCRRQSAENRNLAAEFAEASSLNL